jgi:membrane protease YdiL (CAAX protease family)
VDLVAVSEPRTGRWWTVVAGIEVALAAAAVLLDLAVPTLVILLLAAVSLGLRRERVASLGWVRARHPARLVGEMLAFAAAWTLLQLGLLMPLANHLTGERQDMSDFVELEGNAALLAGLLVLSWTLAAVGEELAYRGFLLTRLTEVVGSTGAGLVAAVAVSSLLFGLAHTEQGAVGVALTTIDAIAFSVLRYRYGTLWAPILAHGFNNTIGFVAFFLVGPVYGFW